MTVPVCSFPRSFDVSARQAVAKQLKKGDVLFTTYHGGYSLDMSHKPSLAISFMQNLVNRIRGRKDKEELYRTTHAVIVVSIDKENGTVLIAESLPVSKRNQLRVADLFSDPYLKLKAGDPWAYQVWRMDAKKGGPIPKQAAKIAKSLATREFYLPQPENLAEIIKGTHTYSFLKGLISLFCRCRGTVGTEAYAKRLFKQVADETLRQAEGRAKATGGTRDRAFFCSYFAAHAYQQAELAQKLDQITQLKGVREGLEKIKALPEGKERTVALRKWAKEMGKRHCSEITELVSSFHLDPKHTSPRDLSRFLRSKDLFQPILTLQPHNGSNR